MLAVQSDRASEVGERSRHERSAPLEEPVGHEQPLPALMAGQEPIVADEPLVEVARRCPVEAARFLEVVLLSGGLVGVALTFACGCFFLSELWHSCGHCGRPLHLWVLAHCVLQVLQTPLRLALLWRLRCRPSAAHEVAHQIRRLTRSRIWRLSTILSMVSYAWFVVGVVWILNAKFCEPCPHLYRLAVGVLSSAVLKPIMTLGAFRYYFGVCLRNAEEHDGRPIPRGAGEDVIERLPLVVHPQDSAAECQSSCAVCLCDFEGGELLRRLPCCHKFHRQCIDKWLRQNKVCPLCLHDAELPPPPQPRQQREQRLLLGGLRRTKLE